MDQLHARSDAGKRTPRGDLAVVGPRKNALNITGLVPAILFQPEYDKYTGAAERRGAPIILQSEPQRLPTRQWRLGRWAGRSLMRFMGWSFEGELPAVNKCVAICAPHTSNWDFIWGVTGMLALDLDIRWMGKHTIFRWPLKRLFLLMGGTPLVRTTRAGRVAEIVETIGNAPGFIFGLAPEGTREPVARWKSGFYHVARGAKIPIWMVYFDYRKKVVGLGPLFYPGENEEQDMRALRAFYADKHPRWPERYIPYEEDARN